MNMYAERARRIKAIGDLLSSRWNLVACNGTISDKYQVIKVTVEVINKLLYNFLVNQEMYQDIDSKLNNEFLKMTGTVDSVNEVFYHVKEVIDEFNKHADVWVKKHCTGSEDEDE